MADLSRLRDAVTAVTDKLDRLRAAVEALRNVPEVVQDEIDELQTKVEDIGNRIDAIIALAEGDTDTGEPETPPETPVP
jgi:peptidoglycan hydrolase CwlO-like protein